MHQNPSLFDIDVPFKVKNIIPLIDRFIKEYSHQKDGINILDVGGGSGLILNEISSYISEKHGMKINKYALDLTPGMFENQKKINPDILTVLNEDKCNTSIKDSEIDLTLMIDVLEHVANPIKALEELRRISDFVIFKVPLELI